MYIYLCQHGARQAAVGRDRKKLNIRSCITVLLFKHSEIEVKLYFFKVLNINQAQQGNKERLLLTEYSSDQQCTKTCGNTGASTYGSCNF